MPRSSTQFCDVGWVMCAMNSLRWDAVGIGYVEGLGGSWADPKSLRTSTGNCCGLSTLERGSKF